MTNETESTRNVRIPDMTEVKADPSRCFASECTVIDRPSTLRTSIVDFGDWSAESSPGGFAAFLDRIVNAHTDDVNAAIDAGMARTHDATDSLVDMFDD